MRLFVASAPGLEALLADEVRALAGAAPEVLPGGVELDADAAFVERASLSLGLALMVRQRVAVFGAKHMAELEKKAGRLPWPELLPAEGPVRVEVRTRRSRLYHTKGVAERVVRGIAAALGHDPTALPDPAEDEAPAPSVAVRIDEDEVTLSIDTSGDPLYRRGYRRATGKAPLRPDLARALLLCSGWDRVSPLCDPFCGSGTIPIEAALLARGLPPGAGRRFAFERLPWHDPDRFAATRAALLEAALPGAPAPIHASDRDAGAVRATLDNAARAGVGADLSVAQAPLSAAPGLAPEAAPGAVVTNPPHGARVSPGKGLRPLYQSLGARVAALPGTSALGLLVADPRLARATGLPLSTAFVTDHGGTRVHGLIRRG